MGMENGMIRCSVALCIRSVARPHPLCFWRPPAHLWPTTRSHIRKNYTGAKQELGSAAPVLIRKQVTCSNAESMEKDTRSFLEARELHQHGNKAPAQLHT